jgi:hypothetical protein
VIEINVEPYISQSVVDYSQEFSLLIDANGRDTLDVLAEASCKAKPYLDSGWRVKDFVCGEKFEVILIK